MRPSKLQLASSIPSPSQSCSSIFSLVLLVLVFSGFRCYQDAAIKKQNLPEAFGLVISIDEI